MQLDGDIDNGLIFCGSNAYRIDKIVPVSQLIDELIHREISIILYYG